MQKVPTHISNNNQFNIWYKKYVDRIHEKPGIYPQVTMVIAMGLDVGNNNEDTDIEGSTLICKIIKESQEKNMIQLYQDFGKSMRLRLKKDTKKKDEKKQAADKKVRDLKEKDDMIKGEGKKASDEEQDTGEKKEATNGRKTDTYDKNIATNTKATATGNNNLGNNGTKLWTILGIV